MIDKKNRMPHVQSRMINTQHVTEAEAVDGQEVALTRIPPGAIILGGFSEVVEVLSGASSASVIFVNGDGQTADATLGTIVNGTALGATAFSLSAPLRAPMGGWVAIVVTGSDPAATGGDIAVTTEYIVDGRFTEVMPEAALAPDDVAN